MNYLFLGILVFLILMVLAGMYNGFVRCAVGAVAYVLSATVSFVFTMFFSGVFKKGENADAIFFVAIFLVVYTALVIAGISLNLIARLPILSTVNKILGAFAGLILGLAVVFLFFTLIRSLPDIPGAVKLMEMIEDNSILSQLYENNIIDILLDKYINK